VNHSDEFERTSLCFRADQLQRLRTTSKRTGVPIAFMIRPDHPRADQSDSQHSDPSNGAPSHG